MSNRLFVPPLLAQLYSTSAGPNGIASAVSNATDRQRVQTVYSQMREPLNIRLESQADTRQNPVAVQRPLSTSDEEHMSDMRATHPSQAALALLYLHAWPVKETPTRREWCTALRVVITATRTMTSTRNMMTKKRP